MDSDHSRRQFLQISAGTFPAVSPAVNTTQNQGGTVFSGTVIDVNGNPVQNADVVLYDQQTGPVQPLGRAVTSERDSSRGQFEISYESTEKMAAIVETDTGWFDAQTDLTESDLTDTDEIRLSNQLLYEPTTIQYNEQMERDGVHPEPGDPVSVATVYRWVSAVDTGRQILNIELADAVGSTDDAQGVPPWRLSAEPMRSPLEPMLSLSVPESVQVDYQSQAVHNLEHEESEERLEAWHPLRTGLPAQEVLGYEVIPELQRQLENLQEESATRLLEATPGLGFVKGVFDIFTWVNNWGKDAVLAEAGNPDLEPLDLNEYDTIAQGSDVRSDAVKFSFTVQFQDDADERFRANTVQTVYDTEKGSFKGEFTIGPNIDRVGGSESPSSKVSGRIRQPDGSPAAEHTVVVYGDESVQTMTTTGEDGEFSFERSATSHDIQYYQVDDGNPDNRRFDPQDTIAPRDGIPDLYAVTQLEIEDPNDIGAFQLPEAHPLEVRVVDQNETPIEGAGVDVYHYNDGADAGLVGHTGEDGYYDPWPSTEETGIEVRGQVRVQVVAPGDGDEFVDEEKERELQVTDPTEISVTLERADEDSTGDVSGRVLQPGGSPAANHTLVIFEVESKSLVEMIPTDGEGFFTYSSPGGRHDVQYYQLYDTNTDNKQFDPGGPRGPRDGTPDIFAITQHEGSEPLGTLELPEAYPLDIRVVDQDGNPIQHARVTVEHYNDEADAGLGEYLTNADGYFVWGSGDTGIEVRGDVTVVVRPPESSDNYEISKNEREVQVTEPGMIEVSLDQIDP